MRTIIIALILTGCSEYDRSSGGSYAPSDGDAQAPAGTLTAGAWDDNRNYDHFQTYAAEIAGSLGATRPRFDPDQQDAAYEASLLGSEPRELLDIALVLDTTGSMGDELSYLATEFEALTESIGEAYPHADQRWALVVYRDDGDAYVTRTVDFTSNLGRYQEKLSRQRARGGGDTPEAPDRGLEAAMDLDWRAGPAARLMFWVADAPHHSEHADRLVQAVEAAAERDVHIYPVAASGSDALTEYTMRASAQITQGRYLFLTDDSGVGDAHSEPLIPCYFVTRLDHAIQRMVDVEMTGEHREPAAEQVIRTGGDPTDGRCVLDDEQVVFAF